MVNPTAGLLQVTLPGGSMLSPNKPCCTQQYLEKGFEEKWVQEIIPTRLDSTI